jgi:hypothetical protein
LEVHREERHVEAGAALEEQDDALAVGPRGRGEPAAAGAEALREERLDLRGRVGGRWWEEINK